MAVASPLSFSISSTMPDIVLCMVSIMVRRLFIAAICGGSSVSNCGMTESRLSRFGLSSSSFWLILSTPSSESYADLMPQQTGML